ncbi:MAG TPA: hypothetical protein VF173_12245 [Thermoanaerobaculia bacterium]|nr:hypothetical protein [Thermoanaerobaculia bacterium]
MTRKLFAAAFLLALCWMPSATASQVAASGATCTAHVCAICAASGLACFPNPHCHCE